MKILQINEDNIEEFVSFLGEDTASDMDRMFFRGLGAVDDNQEPVGAFIYELIGSESNTDTKSIIRLLKCDDDGIAEELQKAYKRDGVTAETIAESYYELKDEQKASDLEGAGFSKIARESVFLRVTLGELSATEFAKKRTLPDYIKPLADISIPDYRSAVKDFLTKGQKGIVEDLAYLPKKWFDEDVSICSTAGDNIDGMFLVRATPSGVLMPMLYYAYGPDYVKNLVYMLCMSLEKAGQKYPPETQVVVCRIKKASRDIMAKLLPQAKGDEVFCGSRKE